MDRPEISYAHIVSQLRASAVLEGITSYQEVEAFLKQEIDPLLEMAVVRGRALEREDLLRTIYQRALAHDAL